MDISTLEIVLLSAMFFEEKIFKNTIDVFRKFKIARQASTGLTLILTASKQ
jgi:hypothetical protein